MFLPTVLFSVVLVCEVANLPRCNSHQSALHIGCKNYGFDTLRKLKRTVIELVWTVKGPENDKIRKYEVKDRALVTQAED